jgi:hypothetical protein
VDVISTGEIPISEAKVPVFSCTLLASRMVGIRGMEPHPSLDIFRIREIEQQLAAELQRAREQLLKATTEEEKHGASELRDRALQRLTDFVARKIVPKEFLQE